MKTDPRALVAIIRRVVGEEVRRIRGQVLGGIARAILRDLDTSKGFGAAALDLRSGEERDDVEHLEPYGFTSAPPAGAEGVALMVGGDASHHVVIALGNRTLRLKGLASGEVAMYTGTEGQVVLLAESGDVVVTPGAGAKVILGGEDATKHVALAEDVDARIAELQVAFDLHVHAGVVAGPASTAVPTTIVGPLSPTAATLVKAK